MPELPEVETMVAYLRERAVEGEIEDVRVLRDPLVGKFGKTRFGDSLLMKGQRLHTIGRRGKYMTFHLSDGILVGHNAMSGYWDIKGSEWCFDYVEGERESKDSDVRMEFDVICHDGFKQTVRYHDARLFGSLKFFPVKTIEEISHLRELGPEPIVTPNADLTMDKSKREWCVLDVCGMNPKHEIKHALMDQGSVVGFGNIYAAETLYLAGVDPFKKLQRINSDEWSRVFEAGQRVLTEALKRKLDYSGLLVYRQSKCVECEGSIEKKDLRGRSTYFCPRCQK